MNEINSTKLFELNICVESVSSWTLPSKNKHRSFESVSYSCSTHGEHNKIGLEQGATSTDCQTDCTLLQFMWCAAAIVNKIRFPSVYLIAYLYLLYRCALPVVQFVVPLTILIVSAERTYIIIEREKLLPINEIQCKSCWCNHICMRITCICRWGSNFWEFMAKPQLCFSVKIYNRIATSIVKWIPACRTITKRNIWWI